MRIDISFAYRTDESPAAYIKIDGMGLGGIKRVKGILRGLEIMLKESQPKPKPKETKNDLNTKPNT